MRHDVARPCLNQPHQDVMNDTHTMDPTSGDLKSQAVQAAEELRSAAASRVGQLGEEVERQAGQVSEVAAEKTEQLRQAAETGWEEAKVKAQDLLQEGEAYVRENPGKSVATALGVGFVLGLLFRR
ncbi:MAG: ElaB/YqjD/DUF883 family membrane-anchored ribosome-binding protein [Verrucomicrobiales bacterium]|jgi:ElaB/YqjD/DUF883 family membrane-anchored ribosome-binding protein